MAGKQVLQHTHEYTYLGLKIISTGNFNLAVNALKAKALSVFYMIKNTIQHEILIQTWLKILKAIIEPIALYGSEIWGPLKTQDFSKWEKEEIEIIHTQICKNILKVNRGTPNNSCRAELGQYPLLINIQKTAVQFQQHLKCSDPSSYQAEALQWQEQNLQKSALLQLVLTLHPNQHNTIRPTQTSTAQPGPTKPAQHNQAQPNQHSKSRPNQTNATQSGPPKPAQHNQAQPNQHSKSRPNQTSTAQPGPTKPAQHNQAQPNQHSKSRPNQTNATQSGRSSFE